MTEIIYEPGQVDKTEVGDWIVIEADGGKQLCLISQVDTGKVAAITVEKNDANRYVSPIEVKNIRNLTIQELNKITGNNGARKVDVIITVKEK